MSLEIKETQLPTESNDSDIFVSSSSSKKRRVTTESTTSDDYDKNNEEEEKDEEEDEEEESDFEPILVSSSPPSVTKQQQSSVESTSTPTKEKKNNKRTIEEQPISLDEEEEEKQEEDEIPTLFKPIQFPGGIAGMVGGYLLQMNRPVNGTFIFQKFKETYTKTQIDKAISTLVDKGFVQQLDESSKIYWINQKLLQQEETSKDKIKMVEKICEKLQSKMNALQKERDEMESKVKMLILAPSDNELDKLIEIENKEIALLSAKILECEQAAKEAEKLGKTAAELQGNMKEEAIRELQFLRNAWRDRKSKLMEFIDNVCDGKGLKKSGKKELLEKIGIETDEDAKVSLLKGTEV